MKKKIVFLLLLSIMIVVILGTQEVGFAQLSPVPMEGIERGSNPVTPEIPVIRVFTWSYWANWLNDLCESRYIICDW